MDLYKKVFVVVSFLFFFTVSSLGLCWAADWTYYYRAGDEKFYYDKSTIDSSIKDTVILTQRITRMEAGDQERITKVKRMEIDCKEHKYRYLSDKYNKDTEKMVKGNPAQNEPWTWFSLESMMASLYENVCQKQKETWLDKKLNKGKSKKDDEKDKKSNKDDKGDKDQDEDLGLVKKGK